MTNFNPVLFLEEGAGHPLATHYQPYLYNDRGQPRLNAQPTGEEIDLSPPAPDLELGTLYSGIAWREKIVPAQRAPYRIKEFDFHASEVHYQALWATPKTAQAFGMTLLRSGECIHFPYPNLVKARCRYSKWAGHQSPYLGDARLLELLSYNPTDLEYHNFAHVFLSQHAHLPLVISVARWRPFVNEISLADLWVRPGDALVLPPQMFPEAPPAHAPYTQKRLKVVNLHGNRNSALACWFNDGVDSLQTETILANHETMASEACRPHYHQEQTPTRHERPQEDEASCFSRRI